MATDETREPEPIGDLHLEVHSRSDNRSEATFPIVGIGTSAGGLDACRRLLQALPADTGLGFVFVSHLEPDRPSMLAELLSRATRMPMTEVGEPTRVEPNHGYVIPPNQQLGIHHGVLHTLDRVLDRGRNLPVDYFLTTLANDIASRAIGVVLSGTASDGTVGLKAVKAAGGLTFAQDKASAEHFGMPGNAIAAGCVDFTLSPEAIAQELTRIARHPYLLPRTSAPAPGADAGDEQLGKIFMLLRNRTGNDFTHYKRTTVLRRIRRRMAVHKLERLADYARLIQSQPAEADQLFDDLLINVTGFFREPDAFDALRTLALPRIFAPRDPPRPVRIWVPGCSTGEEAYSLAITILEYLGDRASAAPVQIFATDIDAKAIEQARTGLYSEASISELSPGRRRRFLTQVTGGWQIAKGVRDLCVFAVQNLIKDPPFSRLDLVCCRNLLIYLGPILQERALQLFHYALEPQGYLLLGASESIGGHAELFSLVDKKQKLYRTKTNLGRINYTFAPRVFERVSPATDAAPPSVHPGVDLAAAADRQILKHYGPPGVVVTRDLEILHFCGETGPFLNPSPGAASLHLLKLARADLSVELRTAVHRAIKGGKPVRACGVRYRRDGADGSVDIHVWPMAESLDGQALLLVLFEDATPPTGAAPVAPLADDGRAAARIAALERELASTRAYMQSIIHDREGANEEIQSANEELQSANEELQSTNEELETAKEELQSTNEELATVNDELETRNLDLGAANSDLTNLLASVNLPILMVWRDLRIRQFTPQAKQLLNLIPSDVGRPIGNIKPNIDIPRFEGLLLAVIDDMTPHEVEAQDNAGRWYSVRVRPYKSVDNRIDGAVVAFIDIDHTKTAERLRAVLEREQRLAAIVRDATDVITVLAFDGTIQAWNPAAERLYGYTEERAVGMDVAALVPPDLLANHQAMMSRLRCGESAAPFATERVTERGQRLPVWLTAVALLNPEGAPYAVSTIERRMQPLEAAAMAAGGRT